LVIYGYATGKPAAIDAPNPTIGASKKKNSSAKGNISGNVKTK